MDQADFQWIKPIPVCNQDAADAAFQAISGCSPPATTGEACYRWPEQAVGGWLSPIRAGKRAYSINPVLSPTVYLGGNLAIKRMVLLVLLTLNLTVL